MNIGSLTFSCLAVSELTVYFGNQAPVDNDRSTSQRLPPPLGSVANAAGRERGGTTPSRYGRARKWRVANGFSLLPRGRGTDGSNPSPSSRESVSRTDPAVARRVSPPTEKPGAPPMR